MSDLTTTAARPDPARLRVECYPVVDEIATRYGDMDANAHLNNLALESLQLGDDRLMAAAWGGEFTAELPPDADFGATARRIASLDLVISVDTATAHLVGAMGHPGWVLLPWGSDPRWLRQRGSSPWYPSLQLLRQPAHRDWGGLVTGVLERFSAWLALQPAG